MKIQVVIREDAGRTEAIVLLIPWETPRNDRRKTFLNRKETFPDACFTY